MLPTQMKTSRVAFFIIAWFGMLVYFAQRWIFGPLIPTLMEAFSANSTTLGVIGSASMWGYMFMPIVAGSISDRFGRKHAILLGVFGFSGLTVLSGCVHTATHLFWTRFFTGTLEAFYFVPITAFTLELFPERPAFFVSLLTSGAALGWFVGPAIAGWLLDVTGTWRSAFLVVGSAGLLAALLQWWFWPKISHENRCGLFFNKGILLPRNMLMLFLLGLVLTFQMASEFGFSMWFPVYLRTEVMMTATGAGMLAGFFGLGQAIGRTITGIVSDRVGYRRTGIAASVLMGVFLMLTMGTLNTPLRVLFTFVAGFVGTAATSGVWTFTGLAFAPFKGLALGIVVTLAYCAASLSPITMGYIGGHYSIATALWTITVPCAFAAAACAMPTFLLRRTEKAR